MRQPAPTKHLLSCFDAAHLAHIGRPALIHGAKHGAILAKVWRTYGTELTEQLIGQFFRRNSFADRVGYSIEVFVSQVPRLVLQVERSRPRDGAGVGAWRDECAAVHGGRCTNAHFHRAMMGR